MKREILLKQEVEVDLWITNRIFSLYFPLKDSKLHLVANPLKEPDG